MIGCHVTVQDAANKCLVGLNGTVQNETKNMLVIMTTHGRRMVPKGTCSWRVRDRVIRVAGRRYHERLSIP